MANETPKTVQTESLINPPEAPARKAKSKRGRPTKAAASATSSSLTRTTTRKIARSKTALKQKAAPPAPKITVLNRLVNFSVVLAVFVTALAIQRIVPTEPLNTPKVEALPAQATAPATPAPVAEVVPTAVAAPESAATAPAPTPTVATEAPKVATTNCNPPTVPAPKPAAAPQRFAKKHKALETQWARGSDSHATPLNSGGVEDLDSEIARQTYMAKTKLATRTPTK